MSRKPSPSVQRIKLDANGYDANGAYYGAGKPVFLITEADGHSRAVRATSIADAKRIAAATPAPAAKPTHRAAEPKPKRKTTTRYETTWRHPLTGQTHKLGIRHTRDYLSLGQDHIEIVSATPTTPHPLSATGYLSHFIAATELINAGGPVSLVDGLLAKALCSKDWLGTENRRAQGDLFQWADAQAEVATKRKPDRPGKPTPARRRTPRTPS